MEVKIMKAWEVIVIFICIGITLTGVGLFIYGIVDGLANDDPWTIFGLGLIALFFLDSFLFVTVLGALGGVIVGIIDALTHLFWRK